MARVLFDHECSSCSNVFEEFADPNDPKGLTCPACGSTSTLRLMGAFTIDPKLGTDASAFPTMGDKWIKKRRQRKQIEDKLNRSHGD